MRRVLTISASALALGLGASAAMADEPANAIKLTLGGGAVENFGYVDNPSGKDTGLDTVGGVVSGSHHGTHVFSFGDAWITFDGKAKLDNGIQVEVNMQLNGSAQTEGGDWVGASGSGTFATKPQISNEADWIAFSGSFGRFEFGDDFNPAANYRFGNDAPYYGTSGMDWPRHTGWIVGPAANSPIVGNQEHAMMDDYEATKIVYQTPIFQGFQVSASYTPSIGSADNYNLEANQYAFSGAGATTAGGGGDQWIGMVSYKNTFGDWSINSDVDYGYEDLFGQTAISGGLNIGYQGFKIGGAAIYRYADNPGGVPSLVNGAANTLSFRTLVGQGVLWDVGVGYGNGPWGVAFAYARDEAYDSGRVGYGGAVVAGDATMNNYALTGKYTIGPGVDVSLETGILDYDVPDGMGQDKLTGGYALLGTELSF